MEAEAARGAPFRGVGLYLLKGRLCLERGAIDQAATAFERETALSRRGHLYGRECCANAWCDLGACGLVRGDTPGAREAFEEVLALLPGHPQALAGLAILDGPDSDAARALAHHSSHAFELVVARAAMFAHAGNLPAAVALVHDALAAAPPGNTGWSIPLDPLLRVWEQPRAWASVCDLLHLRAR